MSYVYIYKIRTKFGNVVKVGHGKTKPKLRMKEYVQKYQLNADLDSLCYEEVYNSKQAEKFIHKALTNSGYTNIRDNQFGPQELFQAPKESGYFSTLELFGNLVNEWNEQSSSHTYKASELVGAAIDKTPSTTQKAFSNSNSFTFKKVFLYSHKAIVISLITYPTLNFFIYLFYEYMLLGLGISLLISFLIYELGKKIYLWKYLFSKVD